MPFLALFCAFWEEKVLKVSERKSTNSITNSSTMFSVRAYLLAVLVAVASAFAPIARGMFFHAGCAKIDEKTISSKLLTFVSFFP